MTIALELRKRAEKVLSRQGLSTPFRKEIQAATKKDDLARLSYLLSTMLRKGY